MCEIDKRSKPLLCKLRMHSYMPFSLPKSADNMGCDCFRDKGPLSNESGNAYSSGPAVPPNQESQLNLSASRSVPMPKESESTNQAGSHYKKAKRASQVMSQATRESQVLPRNGVKLRPIRVAAEGLARWYDAERVITAELTTAQVKESHKKCWIQMCVLKVDKQNQDKNEQRAETLRHLDHPNVLKILDVFQDRNHCYATYEATEGRSAEDLTERIGGINEQWASTIMRQVFAAIRHCHTNGLVLGSLSLKHVLFTETPAESCTFVKVLIPNGDKLEVSSGYVAPELKKKQYFGPANDIWSCGIIISALLAGEFMLQEQSKSGASQEFKGAYLKWQRVNKEVKSLALSMLNRNYQKRATLDMCLQHPWLAASPCKPVLTPSLRTVLRNMSSIKPVSPLKKELLRLILNLVVPNEDLKTATEAFRELDADLDGVVSEAELQTQLTRLFSGKQAQTALAALTNSAVFSADRTLVYSEFLLSVCQQTLSSKANVDCLFRILDNSRDQRVTAGEVRAMLCLESGDSVDYNAWTVLMHEIGKTHEEPVTSTELRALILTDRKDR